MAVHSTVSYIRWSETLNDGHAHYLLMVLGIISKRPLKRKILENIGFVKIFLVIFHSAKTDSMIW